MRLSLWLPPEKVTLTNASALSQTIMDKAPVSIPRAARLNLNRLSPFVHDEAYLLQLRCGRKRA
jgi:hypothetical protein